MRHRLAVIAAATTAMVTIAFVVPLALVVRSAARDRALDQAREVSQVLAPALALGDARTTEVALASATSVAVSDVTVVTTDGEVVGSPAPDGPALARARGGEAFTRRVAEGLDVYTPVLTGDPGRIAVIRVHVPEAALEAGVARAWTVLALLGVVLIAGAVGVADRLGRTTVGAARGVAATARRLSAGDLDARVSPAGPPEVADVAVALNGLAARIRDLLAEEREAAADLSHRLRTPMTALRVDIGELPDSDRSRRLEAALDDLERQVDRIIRDTRRPAGARPRPIDVGELVAARAAFWEPLAEDQGRPWTVDAPPGVVADVDGGDLSAALDALLGNVFAHTPEGAACHVAVRPDGDRLRVIVGDAGPGFADSGVLSRGASGAGSTGLGLDIARRVAEAAGGGLRLRRSPLGGAEVVLDLPRA